MSRSIDWLKRQSRDPFVQERIKRGLNSRSAFKLEQLDEKLKFIARNKKVVDLGACPGRWTQILLERGLQPPENLRNQVKFIVGDFTTPEVRDACLKELGSSKVVRGLANLSLRR